MVLESVLPLQRLRAWSLLKSRDFQISLKFCHILLIRCMPVEFQIRLKYHLTCFGFHIPCFNYKICHELQLGQLMGWLHHSHAPGEALRSRWMWSTSLSMETSRIHPQVQKCMKNTSWEWTGVPDQWKRIYRTMQKSSTAVLALGLLHNP